MVRISQRAIIHILVEGDHSRRLKIICDQRGMTRISVVSRLVKWLARQDPEVQSDILNNSGDWSAVMASNLLGRIASGRRADAETPSKNKRSRHSR
jgi:hypothetical protein